MTTDITHFSATKIKQLMCKREISTLEVVDAHLDVIKRLNPKLNAIVTLVADQARESAKEAQKLINDDPNELPGLLGLPIVIKDIVETAGIRTTWASALYSDFIPKEDAEVVARLRTAGAIVIGKSNTPEFAAGANTDNELFGATGNPWNPALSPSGSSGGSAAAVASGMAPLAQGTDFGCSLRMPAAFCGIVGLRTTPGLISNYPLALPWDPGQVLGPMARTSEDAAMLLDAMKGFSRKTPNSVHAPWESAFKIVLNKKHIKDLRFAYVADIAGHGIDLELEKICREAAYSLSDYGAEIQEIEFDLSDARGAYLTLRGAWMVGMQYKRLDKLHALGSNLRGNIESGLKISTRKLAKAEDMKARVWKRYYELFQKFDALLVPMSPVAPFPVEDNFPKTINGKKMQNYVDWIAGAFLVTMAGLPAASIPVGLSSSRLPVGLQVVSPRFGEPLILSIGKFLQKIHPMPWPTWAAVH